MSMRSFAVLYIRVFIWMRRFRRAGLVSGSAAEEEEGAARGHRGRRACEAPAMLFHRG